MPAGHEGRAQVRSGLVYKTGDLQAEAGHAGDLARAGHDAHLADLKVAQDLYERKLLTYPRTDSRHLTRDMHGDVQRYRDFVLRQEYDVMLIKAAQQWTFDALTPGSDRARFPASA